MKKENAHIVYLQETHLSNTEHEKLKRMGFTQIYYSSYHTGHRRGVIILISNKIIFEKKYEFADKEGRFIFVHGVMNGTYITLFNIYAPPGSNVTFFQKIFQIISSETQGILICGGDLNVHLQPELDSSNKKVIFSKPIHRKINTLMNDIGIIDVWRDLYPNTKDYTHFSPPHNVYTRIDYYLMFNRDRTRVTSCDIGTIDISDHAPIYLTVKLDNKSKDTLWKLNLNLLNDPSFKICIKNEIHSYLETNDNEEVTPPILWDAAKAVLRGKIIALASLKKKTRQQELKKLQHLLNLLEKEHKDKQTPKILEQIKKTRNEINMLYTQEIEKKIMFSKQKYYENGSKFMKILAWKLKKQQADQTIYKVKDPITNTIQTKQENIHDTFERYYKKLYSKMPEDRNQEIDCFLDTLELPTITDEQNKTLIAEITANEVKGAITKLKSNKSPGPDGFTGEWYKVFQKELIPILVRTFNWVLKNAIAPPSWKDAVISIIPKEGKDKLECGSYRPLSILNVDYRLFTSIMSRRMEEFLPNLINQDQSGFIRQRQTQDNIRRTLQVMNYIKKNKLKSMILSLDAEKAFDSVNWTYLYKVLHKFGFHKDIIRSIQALYDTPTAKIKINGYLSKSFTLERGTRQGCPWSPQLFALYLEPLVQSIRQDKTIQGISIKGVEHKIACYADDILIYLGDPTKSLPQLMKQFQSSGPLSGYKLNIEKTEIFHIIIIPL